MSLEISSERVCYVHCNFCNTILAVSVPCNSMTTIVTVRCGHCANLLSVNMGALLHSLPLQDLQNLSLPLSPSGPSRDVILYIGLQILKKQPSNFEDATKNCGSSSKCSRFAAFESAEHQQPRMPPIRPPEKRQRVPSAYNRFIKEEIQRIKANNPEISHREAFSTAAKNWAHFPHIHFGATRDSNKQPKLDHAVVGGEGAHKSRAFC